MAVATSPEPLIKSQPDVNKLHGFNSPVVTVTRHKAARGTPGFSVVTSQSMKVAQILELPTQLPLMHGSGFYKFTVADTVGGDSEAWMVALGNPEQQETSPMPMPPFSGVGGPAAPLQGAPPIDPNVVKQIAPGFYYNQELNLLTTPWRETLSWTPNDPWPKPPATQHQQSHLAVVPPNATPWNWPGQQQGWSGWGGYPVGSDSDELKATKAQLDEIKRMREMDQIREDNRRREEEQRRRDEERDRTTREMFEKIAAALTAKPSGPSETELRLQREAEETRRRLEESERRASEERKEQQRREEARASEDRHREEMRLMREDIKAATAVKGPDPMIGMLTSMINGIQSSATETVRTIKDTIAQGSASAERFMMNPLQVMEMVKSSKTDAGEMASAVLSMSKEMISSQKEVYTSLLDIAGNSGQPAWVGLASEAMGKIGAIGQALAERNAREQQSQVQYTPPQRPMPRRPVQQVQPGGPPQQVQTPTPTPIAPPTGRPGKMDTGGRPEGTTFDAKTEEFILADGMRIKQSDVEREGWKKTLAEGIRARGVQQGQVQPMVAVQPEVVSMNGAAPGVNGAAPPVNAPPASVNKRGRKKPTPAAEPVPAVVGEVLPPPANEAGYTLAEMVDVEPEVVLEAIAPMADDILFGDLWQYIPQLRALTNPLEVVKYIQQGQQFLSNQGKTAPAMDLLAAEQLEAFVTRLLPQATEAFRDQVGEALAEAMGIGGDEADA